MSVSLTIVLIILLIGQNNLNAKHKLEIARVISEKGGHVEKIEKVSLGSSPFAEANRSNVIYKVYYTKNEKEYVAWYRGVNVPSNIHAENPTALEDRFNEKWIFDE